MPVSVPRTLAAQPHVNATVAQTQPVPIQIRAGLAIPFAPVILYFGASAGAFVRMYIEPNFVRFW